MPFPCLHLVPDRDAAGASVASLVGAELSRLATGTTTGQRRPPLLGLATGATFTTFFPWLERYLRAGQGSRPPGAGACRLTHLDEFLSFDVDQPGGMVHELTTACPTLGDLLDDGVFWPVPSDGTRCALEAHEARIAAAGGISLQLLGLGRNGHIAFNEPGTDFDLGFHRTHLAEETRADARARFAPDPVPSEAVTAGPRSILAAHRLLLVALGDTKAQAVRDMIEGPVHRACPASVLRRHPALTVLLDPPATALLDPALVSSIRPFPNTR